MNEKMKKEAIETIDQKLEEMKKIRNGLLEKGKHLYELKKRYRRGKTITIITCIFTIILDIASLAIFGFLGALTLLGVVWISMYFYHLNEDFKLKKGDTSVFDEIDNDINYLEKVKEKIQFSDNLPSISQKPSIAPDFDNNIDKYNNFTFKKESIKIMVIHKAVFFVSSIINCVFSTGVIINIIDNYYGGATIFAGDFNISLLIIVATAASVLLFIILMFLKKVDYIKKSIIIFISSIFAPIVMTVVIQNFILIIIGAIIYRIIKSRKRVEKQDNKRS